MYSSDYSDMEQIVCVSQSKVGLGILSSTATTAIPGNVAITKIYASVRQSDNEPIDNGTIQIGEMLFTSFFQIFNVDIQSRVGEFEITFEQPLWIGFEDVNAILSSYFGNIPVIADLLTLTVIYYPINNQEYEDEGYYVN